MIRMSMLRNVPVILEEKQIGLFHSACFDQTRKRVRALIVSSGMRGKRIVQAQHVRMIAEGFILIDGWEKYRRTDKQQTSLFVRDTTGLLAGRVTDYAIDKRTLEVLAIEVVSGYLPREICKRDWLYAYSFAEDSDELSIPVVLHSGPCFSREGNEECGCPP